MGENVEELDRIATAFLHSEYYGELDQSLPVTLLSVIESWNADYYITEMMGSVPVAVML